MMRHPIHANGITRWVQDGPQADAPKTPAAPEIKERSMPILRHEIGDVLRDVRQRQGRTLREVSHDARVSLGYLSEVERGQKEASSELLASICDALDVPLSAMLREVSDRIAEQEGVTVPDTVPDELTAGLHRGTGRVGSLAH
jgi:ribosome-binding protein aMBF1 (putative translation factor)